MSKILKRTTITVGKNDPTADYNCNTSDDIAIIQSAMIQNPNSVILIKSGLYEGTSQLRLIDYAHIKGEKPNTVEIKMKTGGNKTLVISNYNNKQLEYAKLENLILNQNADGQNQTAGGCIVFAGAKLLELENVICKKSLRYGLLIQSLDNGVNLTGTIVLTQYSKTVTGTGTSFTTQLKPRDIIKLIPSGRLLRVENIISDTELVLQEFWLDNSQTGLNTYRLIPKNCVNAINCEFQGTNENNVPRDNVGLGVCDNFYFENCKSFDSSINSTSAGCGFVPDHCSGGTFLNCHAYNNINSGFSFETSYNIKVIGGSSFANIQNGVQLISGSANCIFDNHHTFDNLAHGFSPQLNNIIMGYPDNNVFTNCYAYNNGRQGFRIDGSKNNIYDNCYCWDNCKTATNESMITINTSIDRTPDNNTFNNVYVWDTRAVKKAQYAINVAGGINNKIINLQAVSSDYLNAIVNDGGTNTLFVNFKNGGLTVNTQINGLSGVTINTPVTDREAGIMVAAAGKVGAIIQQGSNQGSVNLQEFQSTAGNPLSAVSSGGLFRAPFGSVSAPAYAFQANGGLGMYRSGLDTLRFTTANNDRVEISNTKMTVLHRFNTATSTYADNALAIAGGLVAGDVYKTSTGEVRIVI